MQALPLLDVRTRQRWRAWLATHHAASEGVWLVCYKAHTGVKSLSHADLLSEALCFGWIDSLVRRLDEDRYAIKVTPRRPASKWSDINRKRWAQLKAGGLLAPAGLAAAPTRNTYAPRPLVPELPGYIATAIKGSGPAWKFVQALPESERRRFVVWIHTAKRAETRKRRILESLRLLGAQQRLGLK
jgi:uncharacterized protein YdeI (YjbR/CyaY-like superfamily)